MGKRVELESIRVYLEGDLGTIEQVFDDGRRSRANLSPDERESELRTGISISRAFKVPLMIIDWDQAKKAIAAKAASRMLFMRQPVPSRAVEEIMYLSEFSDPFK